MTPGWAEKRVVKVALPDDWGIYRVNVEHVLKLLTQEHRRALRVVKAYEKRLASVPVTCDKARHIQEGVLAACTDILAALQKGRT